MDEQLAPSAQRLPEGGRILPAQDDEAPIAGAVASNPNTVFPERLETRHRVRIGRPRTERHYSSKRRGERHERETHHSRFHEAM
jgi:hypothetical protein